MMTDSPRERERNNDPETGTCEYIYKNKCIYIYIYTLCIYIHIICIYIYIICIKLWLIFC